MHRSPENVSFSFFPAERHYQIPECFHRKAVSELVQQFYHATEIANVAIAVSACTDQL